ncbi:MAG: recombinase family protein [Vulcanococcus sp.]
MRVGYCRVSTTSGEQLSALEGQVARVQAAGVERVITDVESGRSTDRPGLVELLELIDTRQVSEVVATRVDRLGRDANATDALIVLAGKRGVTITTLDGGAIEAVTPTGFVMARLSTTLAEMESRMLSLRIRRGLEQRRKQKHPCRGKAPWGYRINAERTAIEPDPLEWERAQRFLAELERCGWRMNTALDRFEPIPLNSCRAVKAWLINPILRGGIGWRQQKNHRFEQVEWGLHEPLIHPTAWLPIELALEQNRRCWGRNSVSQPKLLTGLVWCPKCGKRQSYAGSRSIPSLICRTRTCEARYKGTRESVIVEAVTQELAKRAQVLATLVDEPIPAVVELRSTIARLEALNDPDLEGAINAKRERLAALQSAPNERQLELARALADPLAWEEATPEELRAVFLDLVERIDADRGQVAAVHLRV